MPWLVVNQTLLLRLSDVPTPVFELDVQWGSIPGHPGARRSDSFTGLSLAVVSKQEPQRLREAFRPRSLAVGGTFVDPD